MNVLIMQFIAINLFPYILKTDKKGRIYFSEKDFKKEWEKHVQNSTRSNYSMVEKQ